MSRSQTLIFTGLLLLGAAVVWQSVRISGMERTLTALLERETAKATTGASPADESFRNGNAATDPRPASPGSRPGEASGRRPRNPEREAEFRAKNEMDRKQRQDSKILALTTKLNLMPDQQTAIRAALDKGSAERAALREAGFARWEAGNPGESEETRRAEKAKWAAVDAAEEQAIAAGLSAEQLAAYTEYRTEQKQTRIENRANFELGDLLNRFSLTEDQKDAAFQFFAKQAQDSGADSDPAQRQKNVLEAMKRILTPEQYDLYKTQQEQRASTSRGAPPGEGPGGPPPGRP